MDYPFLTQDCYDIEPESEEAKQEKEFPVQYIANIQDKNIVGYKYFDFKDTKKLTLTIRARSQNVAGKSLEDFSCGIIPVEISENTEKNWITVSCELLLEKGTYPLYLKYEGVGEVDLAQFELI